MEWLSQKRQHCLKQRIFHGKSEVDFIVSFFFMVNPIWYGNFIPFCHFYSFICDVSLHSEILEEFLLVFLVFYFYFFEILHSFILTYGIVRLSDSGKDRILASIFTKLILTQFLLLKILHFFILTFVKSIAYSSLL